MALEVYKRTNKQKHTPRTIEGIYSLLCIIVELELHKAVAEMLIYDNITTFKSTCRFLISTHVHILISESLYGAKLSGVYHYSKADILIS